MLCQGHSPTQWRAFCERRSNLPSATAGCCVEKRVVPFDLILGEDFESFYRRFDDEGAVRPADSVDFSAGDDGGGVERFAASSCSSQIRDPLLPEFIGFARLGRKSDPAVGDPVENSVVLDR